MSRWVFGAVHVSRVSIFEATHHVKANQEVRGVRELAKEKGGAEHVEGGTAFEREDEVEVLQRMRNEI